MELRKQYVALHQLDLDDGVTGTTQAEYRIWSWGLMEQQARTAFPKHLGSVLLHLSAIDRPQI